MTQSPRIAIRRTLRPLAAAALLLGALIMFSGCQTVVPRFRTLPKNYQTIYVPMVNNQTFEPGLDEVATRLIQEEFMADGRLRVTRREDADIVVHCQLDRFNRKVTSEEDDNFPQSEQAEIAMTIFVFERGAAEPFGIFPNVLVSSVFLSNPRQSLMRPEPDWKKDLMSNLAREVVVQVITGDYAGTGDVILPADPMFPAGGPPGVRPNRGFDEDARDRELDYRL